MTLPTSASEVVHIPFKGGDVLAVDVDGKPYVILRPAIERLGTDYSSQLRKLKNKSWAKLVNLTTQDHFDGMAAVDVRTFLMLLATINEKQVAEEVRDVLVGYQSEVADVIEAYWTRGGAVNPAATVEQLDDLAEEIEQRRADLRAINAKRNLGVIEALGGTVDPTWRESLARHEWAVYSGTEPDIAPGDRMLMAEPYLVERGLGKADVAAIRSMFGKRLKAAYTAEYGREPEMTLGMVNGRERPVKGYYERDRFLFDAVFEEHYPHLVGPVQLELGAA